MAKFLEKQEAEQRRIAAEKAASSARSKNVLMKHLTEAQSKGRKLFSNTTDSVRMRIQQSDAQGNISIRTYPGITSDYSPDALVTSNHKSRRRRLERLRSLIMEIHVLIEYLNQFGPKRLPEDLPDHLAALFESVPDENVMEVISSPKSKK